MTPRVVLSSIFFLVAPIAAIHAQLASGNLAPSWATSWNGFNLADEALEGVRSSQSEEERLEVAVLPEATKLAREAYSKEPLATNSHFVLSLDAGQNSERLLRTSRGLEKRNRLITLYAAQSAAENQELLEVMSLVDELSRLEPQLASQFVSLISDSLSDPASAPIIRSALTQEPSWGDAFWRKVPQDSAGLDVYLTLQESLNPELDEQAQKNVIDRLVRAQRLPEAFRYYAAFRNTGRASSQADQFILPPIDWVRATSRAANARILSENTIDFFVAANGAGQIARKLVTLSPGEYSLQSSVHVSEGHGFLTAELNCASGEDTNADRVKKLEGSPKWEISHNGCSYFWLTIKGSAWDSSIPLKGTVTDLNLVGPSRH